MSKKISIFLIIVFLLVVAFVLFQLKKNQEITLKEVQAAATKNIFGWAWGGYPDLEGGMPLKTGSGWISFNSTNTGATIDYGVHIDPSTFKLSGRAWSGGGEEAGNQRRVFGWLSFERSETGAPPSDDPCPDGTCIAKVDNGSPTICDINGNTYLDRRCGGADNSTTPLENYKQVFGWARFCGIPEGGTSIACGGGGWNGWVKFSHHSPVSSNRNFGVVIDTTTNPREFRGWAWGSDVVGWISFNCSNQGSCGNSDYKVKTSLLFNRPPTAINLSVDSHNPTDYCGIIGYPPVRLRWEFYDPGDTQSAFQIRVDDNSNFSSPVLDTGKISGQETRSFVIQPPYPTLSWGTTYYWQIKVWDSQDSPSNWVVYQNNSPPPESFTTINHPYPYVNFNWNPEEVVVNESVQFCSVNESRKCETPPRDGWTRCYMVPCSWSWTFPADWSFATGSTPSTQNPTGHFTLAGDKTVNLKVTDADGLTCPASQSLNVRRLPIWFPVHPR